MYMYKDHICINKIFDKFDLCYINPDGHARYMKPLLSFCKQNEELSFNKLIDLAYNDNNFSQMFDNLFTIAYIYKRRNNIIHEGESFSFENVLLADILANYSKKMIMAFSKDFI